jgi:hypothetical protein
MRLPVLLGKPLITVPASMVKVAPLETYTFPFNLYNVSHDHVVLVLITPDTSTESTIVQHGFCVTERVLATAPSLTNLSSALQPTKPNTAATVIKDTAKPLLTFFILLKNLDFEF